MRKSNREFVTMCFPDSIRKPPDLAYIRKLGNGISF